MSEPYRIIELFAHELPGVHRREACGKCRSVGGYLARVIKVNGSVGLRWVCAYCEFADTASDLPHSLLLEHNVTLDELPKRADYREDTTVYCAVCDAPAVEWHHWAPRAIFTDWPDLGVYLCPSHHEEWHERMRAHGLRWPHELDTAA